MNDLEKLALVELDRAARASCNEQRNRHLDMASVYATQDERRREELSMSDDLEIQALEYQDRLAGMTDGEVIAAYLGCEGLAGDAWANALAAECRDRNLEL